MIFEKYSFCGFAKKHTNANKIVLKCNNITENFVICVKFMYL